MIVNQSYFDIQFVLGEYGLQNTSFQSPLGCKFFSYFFQCLVALKFVRELAYISMYRIIKKIPNIKL